MNDKDLLELAAKAAGFTFNPSVFPRDGSLHGCFLGADSQEAWPWNPLTDDGDALRLAVKLGLDILIQPTIGPTDRSGNTTVYSPFKGESWESDRLVENHDNDPYAATRRAIVRAAAEIGKEMQ